MCTAMVDFRLLSLLSVFMLFCVQISPLFAEWMRIAMWQTLSHHSQHVYSTARLCQNMHSRVGYFYIHVSMLAVVAAMHELLARMLVSESE